MTNLPQDVDLDSVPLTHAQLMAFYSKIQTIPLAPDALTTSRCHLWVGSLYKNGYGQYMQTWRDQDEQPRRKGWKAHRLAWILVRGPIAKGLVLDHLCGNRACCNPAHMRLCTQAENVRRRPGLKLSMLAAEDIRWAYEHGSKVKDIAFAFGVSTQVVYAVINLQTWRPAANDNVETPAAGEATAKRMAEAQARITAAVSRLRAG